MRPLLILTALVLLGAGCNNNLSKWHIEAMKACVDAGGSPYVYETKVGCDFPTK